MIPGRVQLPDPRPSDVRGGRRTNGEVAGVISVRVPATSANLGPGYDAVGLALSLSMRIGLDRSPHRDDLQSTGADLIPRGPGTLPTGRPASWPSSWASQTPSSVWCRTLSPDAGSGPGAAALVGGAVAPTTCSGSDRRP